MRGSGNTNNAKRSKRKRASDGAAAAAGSGADPIMPCDAEVEYHVSVMVANIEGLGGGFVGRRDDNTIKRIAEIFVKCEADVIAVLEVMLRGPCCPIKPVHPSTIKSHQTRRSTASDQAKTDSKKQEAYRIRLENWKKKFDEWKRQIADLTHDKAVKYGRAEIKRVLTSMNTPYVDTWGVYPPLNEPCNLGGETVRFLYRKSKVSPKECEAFPRLEVAGKLYRQALFATFVLEETESKAVFGVCALHAPSPNHPFQDRMTVCENAIECARIKSKELECLFTMFAADTNLNTLSTAPENERKRAKSLFTISGEGCSARQNRN